MTPELAAAILLAESLLYAGLLWGADQHRRHLWEDGFRRGYLRGRKGALDDVMASIAAPAGPPTGPAEHIAIQQVPLRPDGTTDQVRLAEMIAEQIAGATGPPPGPLPGSRLHGNPRVN